MLFTFSDMRVEVWTLGATGRSTDSTRQDKKPNKNSKSLCWLGGWLSTAILWWPLSFQRQTRRLCVFSCGSSGSIDFFFSFFISAGNHMTSKFGLGWEVQCTRKTFPEELPVGSVLLLLYHRHVL